jgi:hypothetical protein
MRTRIIHAALALASLIAVAVVMTGCELLVQLDRSAVDGGEDASCPICADGGDDASDATAATDADGGS